MKGLGAFLFLLLFVFAAAGEEKSVVGRLSLEGNGSISRKELLGSLQMETGGLSGIAFDDELLARALRSIRRSYRARGYYLAEVNYQLEPDTSSGMVDVTFLITEGPRFLVDKVVFAGNRLFGERFCRLAAGIVSGDPLDSFRIEQGRITLLDSLRSGGRLFSKIFFEINIRQDMPLGTVSYIVDEGPVVVAGEIVTVGLEKVRREVVLRALTFRPGDVVTPEKISASMNQLNATGLFTSVFLEPVDTFAASPGDTVTVPVLVAVEERDMFGIQAGGGYGAFQGWYVHLQLLYRNFFGLGHRGAILGRLSQEEVRGELSYQYPYLLRFPVNALFRSYLERRSQDAYEGFFWGGIAQISPSSAEELTWRIYSRAELALDLDLTEPSTPLFPQREEKNTFVLGGGLQWDTRSGLFQMRGQYSELRAELAGPFLPNTNQFYKVSGGTAFFYPLGGKVTGMGAVQAGLGRSYGADQGLLPVQERFRIGFGGIPPIRGYGEGDVMPRDELGEIRGAGALFVVTPLEVRFPLFWRFQGALFLDGGNAWRSPGELDLGDLRWAAGPGILLLLPFGVVRVDYGVQLDEDLQGRIHISAGAF